MPSQATAGLLLPITLDPASKSASAVHPRRLKSRGGVVTVLGGATGWAKALSELAATIPAPNAPRTLRRLSVEGSDLKVL